MTQPGISSPAGYRLPSLAETRQRQPPGQHPPCPHGARPAASPSPVRFHPRMDSCRTAIRAALPAGQRPGAAVRKISYGSKTERGAENYKIMATVAATCKMPGSASTSTSRPRSRDASARRSSRWQSGKANLTTKILTRGNRECSPLGINYEQSDEKVVPPVMATGNRLHKGDQYQMQINWQTKILSCHIAGAICLGFQMFCSDRDRRGWSDWSCRLSLGP